MSLFDDANTFVGKAEAVDQCKRWVGIGVMWQIPKPMTYLELSRCVLIMIFQVLEKGVSRKSWSYVLQWWPWVEGGGGWSWSKVGMTSCQTNIIFRALNMFTNDDFWVLEKVVSRKGRSDVFVISPSSRYPFSHGRKKWKSEKWVFSKNKKCTVLGTSRRVEWCI
jgi:hypothetical protein